MFEVRAPGRAMDRAGSWILPLAVGAVAWMGVYPPMSDLPLHEGIAHLLVRHGDRQWAPDGLYVLSLGHAQQLAQLCMAAAMLVLSSATSAKLVVSLAIAGVVASTARLLRHLGRTPWAAALVAPLALGWLYHWGFVGNLLGLAIFGWLAVSVDRLADSPSPKRSLGVAGWIVLAFLAHATAALAAVVMLVVLVLVRRRRILWALAPAFVFAILAVVERWRERLAPTFLGRASAGSAHWHPLSVKLERLPSFVAGLYDEPVQIAIVGALALAVLTALLRRVTSDSRGLTDSHEVVPRDSRGRRAEKHRFTLVGGALLLAFLAVPYSINYGAFLYVRFLGPAWMCLVGAVAPRRAGWASIAAAVVCVATSIAALVPEIRRADEQHRMLASLYPHVAPGSAAVVVEYGNVPWAAFSRSSPGQRLLAERGGRSLFSFAEYPSSPLVISPEKRWEPLFVRVCVRPGELRPATDFDVLRYVLAHIPNDPLWPLFEEAFLPDARLVARSGEWLLFESTHDVLPVDAPLPRHVSESDAPTIQARLGEAIRRNKGGAGP